MLIINSDDFGISPEVNRAIYAAYKGNLISSTTALVNFEKGFQDAKSLIGKEKIHPNAVGIHFNLTQGSPLSEPILKMNRFCKDGIFVTKRSNPIFSLSKLEKKAVLSELESQLNHFQENFGFRPSHIDSHHHIHTEYAILKLILKVAKQNNIKAIRIARNTGRTNNFIKQLYRKIINTKIRFKGLRTVDYFGDINDFDFFGLQKNRKQEIMVHALYEENVLVDMDKQDLESRVNSLLNGSELKLNNYTDLLNSRESGQII